MLIQQRSQTIAVCLSPAPGVVRSMSHNTAIRDVARYRLWIGPAAVLDDPRAICDLGIEAVVCVALEPLPSGWPRDLIYLRIPLSDDGENPPDLLGRAIDVLSGLIRDDVPTLVVCSMGHSRSVAVAAAAIAACAGTQADDVLRRITAAQPADVSASLWGALKRIL